jgi:hypothetical protein
MAKGTKSKSADPMLKNFVNGYIEAALWSSTSPEGSPLDDKYSAGDFAQEAIDKAVEESADFIRANRADLLATSAPDDQHGHDFWLTRNHHGAGFWDRGYGPLGDRLTKAAHGYGTSDVYVGDDGKLYFM